MMQILLKLFQVLMQRKDIVGTGSKPSSLQHLGANTTVVNAHLLENGSCLLQPHREFSDRFGDVNGPRSEAPFYRKYQAPQKPSQ
jgi:hypothetical protein